LYVGYLYFNMDDPVVGGEAPERLALRRAVLMAYDVAQEIRVVRNGQGRPATQPIPPDADGHVPGLDVRPPYDPAAARALLDKLVIAIATVMGGASDPMGERCRSKSE